MEPKIVELEMRYDEADGVFVVGNTGIIIKAPRDERAEVEDFLGRKLCDNPELQLRLGVLGADIVRFV